jgi:NAD+ diphosphatase
MQCWFIYQNGNLLLVKKDMELYLPTETSTTISAMQFIRQYPLTQTADTSCYCAEIDSQQFLPSELMSIPLRKAFDVLGLSWYNLIVKSFSIIHWDKTHQYCGCCGQKTGHTQGTFERTCPGCGHIFYPRISPSIIVRITKGDHILMARSPHFIPGAYGLIAGFIEVGESAEEAVHREVQEEVDIKIKNLQYFGSQPWPFPDSLMFGFTADYASGELQINTNEIEEAGWYRYDHLPGRPSSSVSLAQKLIDSFIVERCKTR